MATQTLVTLVDDLDGSSGPDMETIEFSIDGVDYVIDLQGYNARNLRDVLQPYITAARRGSTLQKVKRPAKRQTAGATRLNDVREWARARGYQVNERGRIPVSVQQAYNETHGLT